MELNQTLRQVQTLSPQMIQAARLLQMGVMELRDYLREELESNPALESEEHHSDDPGREGGDAAQMLEWLCAGDYQNRTYYQDDVRDPADWLPGGAGVEEENLYSHLRAQVDFKALAPAMAAAVECVLQSLDPSGRLDEPLEDLAVHAGVSRTNMQKAIQIVQGLEPAGVAAQDLSECLELQLLRRKETGLALTIVRFYLEDLAQSHFHQIAKRTGASRKEVDAACRLIRSLDPRPGGVYAPRERAGIIVPDLAVVAAGDGFEVVLNDAGIPALHVSPYCRGLLAQEDGEVREYLTGKLRQAKWVIQAVEQRRATLLNCARSIARRQEDFFRRGPGHLRALTLSDVAEEAGVHESTVSRAAKDKYLQCGYGVFPLKYFFSRGLSGTEGAGDVSAEKAKTALRSLIEGENKQKPLSDQKLCELLAEEGIGISRRTVAKYREELSIPAAAGRKAL